MSSNALILYITVAYLIRFAMVPVILRRQFVPGAAIAWLGIIFLHPYIGLALYVLVGEAHLGRGRVARHRQLAARYRFECSDPTAIACTPSLPVDPAAEPFARQAEKIAGLPIVPGSTLELIDDTPRFIDRLVADLDAATRSAHLLYYIFEDDGSGRRICEALSRAARRGVTCRLIVDAIASRSFLRSATRVELESTGVAVVAALPVVPFRRHLARLDLRNHRKLAILDRRIAFAGSHNIIDADYGGRRGGPWFDLTGRFQGPVVAELATVFDEDWEFETGQSIAPPNSGAETVAYTDGSPMQVVPTGPSSPAETFRRLLLAALQCARSQLILTTPYFVPDEPTVVALMMAADRGVDVKLILPTKPDHLFAAAAGRAHFARLLESGVHIHCFRPGLLHAKTVTVDDHFALLGSANLDVRSFNLNFELTTALYGPHVTQQLRTLQLYYLTNCDELTVDTWSKRSPLATYTDAAISLISPLL
jgi:cardiolipin synthase